LKISHSFFKVDCIFQVKDCQTGEDGETPILSFENGLQLEAGLLVSFLTMLDSNSSAIDRALGF
jgi:hypothetical protein